MITQDIMSLVDLPDLESFTTRKEFNAWKEKTSSFTNRNNRRFQFLKNEHGVIASKTLIGKIEKDTKQAQRIAENLREEATEKPFISGGKVQGTVGQRMLQMGKPNTAGIYKPPDFNFNRIRDNRDLYKKAKNMEERSDKDFFDKRMEQMKENFMEILKLSYHSDAESIIDKIKDVPADDFYEMYLMFDEFDFNLYDSEGQFVEDGNIKQLEHYIDMYREGKIDFSLKGF